MSRQKILNQSGEEKNRLITESNEPPCSKKKKKKEKKELDCLCYCSASISKALDGYFLQILDDVADIFSTDKAFSVCVLCNRFGC